MPAGADVLATDKLEGCEIGEFQVFVFRGWEARFGVWAQLVRASAAGGARG
jgi:hypothetical protein